MTVNNLITILSSYPDKTRELQIGLYTGEDIENAYRSEIHDLGIIYAGDLIDDRPGCHGKESMIIIGVK